MISLPRTVAALFCLIVLVGWTGAAAAETSLTVPSLQSLVRQHGRTLTALVQQFQRADREGQRRIQTAYTLYRRSRDGDARSYYRMDYLEQRILHVRGLAEAMIALLRDQERFVREAERCSRQRQDWLDSPQATGMRQLLCMVLALEELPVLPPGDAALGASIEAQAVTFALANLLAPLPEMPADFRSQVGEVKGRLHEQLDGLRQELDRLGRQVAMI